VNSFATKVMLWQRSLNS